VLCGAHERLSWPLCSREVQQAEGLGCGGGGERYKGRAAAKPLGAWVPRAGARAVG